VVKTVSSTKENKMQLLQDVFIMENLQVIEESSANSKMKIRGTFQRAEEANNNGRIYPTKVLEGQIKKLQPLIEARRLCGELDHPQNDTVKLSNASHLVTKLEMKGNEVLGEAEILKTPAGLTAQALVHGGVSIGISSRGMGTLSEDADGSKVVNEDFNLVTFDLVADPSTRGAYPSLAESRESKFAKTTQTRLEKECNFVTMLEHKMRDAYKPWVEENVDPHTGKPTRASKKTIASKERASKKADAEEANIQNKKFKTTRMKEAFDLVKADGHWHRMAEVISQAMGHDVDEAMAGKGETAAERKADRERANKDRLGRREKAKKKAVDEGMEELLGDTEKTHKVEVKHQGDKREGHLARKLRHRAERKHAERTAVSTAKGQAKGKAITSKGERKEAMKDVKAGGARSREAIKQGTKTHKASEKSQTQKGVATRKAGEEREFSKVSLSRRAGRAAGKAAPHVKRAAKATGKGLRKGSEAAIGGVSKALPKASRAAGKGVGKAVRKTKALLAKRKSA